eukprot:s282_g14.t1
MKVKPITLTNINQEDRELNPKEVSLLRALLGGLQWPATQTAPHLCASVSLCGEVSQSTVATAQQGNKLLRFAKNNSDTGLMFTRLGKLSDLCMIALSDAAWGVRRNSESQGGYFVLLMNSKALQGHMDQPYIILDWRSFKLPRISRSSLNSEAQACSAAMDALEYLMILWHGCMIPDFDLRYLDTQDIAMQSALVIDAKALFDSLKAEVPQLQGDKRTKIEVMITKQKMDEIGTKLRWISSETQLADGVTKIAARQLLADRIRTHLLSLQSDKTFQAAKRKTQAERQASARRNAIGRMVHKGSLGYIVLTNQLVPVRGEDSSHDYFFDIIFTVFIIICSALILQCFQRMTWSFRSSFGSPRTPSTLLQSTSTQTEPDDEIPKMRKHLENQRHRIDMLTQQVHDKDDKISDLQEWINYYQGDLASTPLWVSRAGERFHVRRECGALQNANPGGIRRLTLCSHCIQNLHSE